MGEVRICQTSKGAVIISDTSPENDVYDQGESIKIQTPQGKDITDPYKVKAALAELGISSLPVGTPLEHVRRYWVTYNSFVPLGGSGIETLDVLISQARDHAKDAGIEIDENHIAAIEKESYPRAIKNDLKRAEEYARSGWTDLVQGVISEIRECSKKRGLKVDEDRIRTLAREGYTVAYEEIMDGRYYSEPQAQIVAVGSYLTSLPPLSTDVSYAIDCAKKAGITFDEREIRQSVYKHALQLAINYAGNTHPKAMKEMLRRLRNFGEPMDEDRIFFAKQAGFEKALSRAAQYAKKGNVRMMDHYLDETVGEFHETLRDAPSYTDEYVQGRIDAVRSQFRPFGLKISRPSPQ